MSRVRFAFAVAAGFLIAAPGQAATILFDIFLDGLQETPPIATPATGIGSLSLDDTTGNYTISGTFQDLIGTSNNAHIHGPAAVGVGPAGVIVGLTFDPGVNAGNYSGAGTFTPAQMSDLLNELYYVNIHSSFAPGGEIRGQIVIVPEPSPALLVTLGLGLLGIARRMSVR